MSLSCPFWFGFPVKKVSSCWLLWETLPLYSRWAKFFQNDSSSKGLHSTFKICRGSTYRHSCLKRRPWIHQTLKHITRNKILFKIVQAVAATFLLAWRFHMVWMINGKTFGLHSRDKRLRGESCFVETKNTAVPDLSLNSSLAPNASCLFSSDWTLAASMLGMGSMLFQLHWEHALMPICHAF